MTQSRAHYLPDKGTKARMHPMHGLVEEATGHGISKGLGRQPQRVSHDFERCDVDHRWTEVLNRGLDLDFLEK